MRTDCRPYRIDANGEAIALDRIPFGGKDFPEHKVQELLHLNPSILPVSRFDAGFGPIVSLGREIRNMDNLFVSPGGRLTVVETKLWRNPQAVREVLAQVLEYASNLSRLTCEDLEKICHDAKQSPLSPGESLYQYVAKTFPGQVELEPEFLDALQRTLKQGRFLLLVVGDGIRENLENVLEMLYGHSHLAFTFGLVELRIYEQPEGGYLVVPGVPARSVEVLRAIVKVADDGTGRVTVEVPKERAAKPPRLSEQEFIDQLTDPEVRKFAERLVDWAREHPTAQVSPATQSMAIRLPFSTQRSGLVLLRIMVDGYVRVTPPKLREALRKAKLDDGEVFRVAESLRKLFPELKTNSEANQVVSPIYAGEILQKMEEFLEVYNEASRRLRELDPGGDSEILDDGENETDHDDEN